MKKLLVLAALATIIILGTAGLVALQNRPTSTKTSEVNKPSFSFNQSTAPDWWSGGNNWPDIKNFTGDQVAATDLPIADINVHKGTQTKPGDCFVMAFYYDKTVNVADSLKKRESEMLMGEKDPSILTKVGTSAQEMETPDGTKEYTLYQYNLDRSQAQKGNEFGFIPLAAGHIEVRGVCPTAEQLSTTLTPLSAIKLNP